MFYLVIQNLGKERCIHKSEEDLYKEGMTFSCTPDLEYFPEELVRELGIVCSEVPNPPMRARVFKD